VVLIWFLFGIYGIYMAATDGVGKAFAIDLLEPNQKATGLGVLGSFTGLASLIASVSAGYLWDHFGSSYTFYFAALAASLSAILIFFARDQRRG
jgi:MFS family permease